MITDISSWAVALWQHPVFRWTFYLGWIGILVVAGLLNTWSPAAHKRWLKVIRSSFLFWFFSAFLVGFGNVMQAAKNWPDSTGMTAWFGRQTAAILSHWSRVFQFLDGYLAPATEYLLLIVPILILMFDSKGNKRSGLRNTMIGLWLLGAMSYALVLMIGHMRATPASFLIFASVMISSISFQSAGDIKLRKKYSINTLFKDVNLREASTQKQRFTSLLPGFTFLAIVTAFWFRLEIGRDVLVTYYGALLGGLLAVIGFAALIFTFTYDSLPTKQLRREIARDTRDVHAAAGKVILISIAGMMTVTGPLTATVQGVTLFQAIQISLLAASVSGLLLSIQSILSLFRHLVSIVSEVDFGDINMTIAFEESRTLEKHSSISTLVNGLSQLKAHIEDADCRVLSLSKPSWRRLIEMENTVVVLPFVNSAVSADDLAGMKELVAKGDVLVIMADSGDNFHKTGLFHGFGIAPPTARKAGGVWVNATIPDGQDSKSMLPSKYPYAFTLDWNDKSANQIVLAQEELPEGSERSDPMPFIIATPYGDGWVITATTFVTWNNANATKNRAFDMFDVVLKFASQHFSAAHAGDTAARETAPSAPASADTIPQS